eukprot:TRINITY_DN10108_c0_g1_i1.p1 TRINITY_DN10108_c0_g1~~TRINITY_DN10108_c0_g1_i1.p1  ORF type:complete len:593 (+),score=197.79 TRINITY_DN10108_c0_g1_i1:1858-3636(+)
MGAILSTLRSWLWWGGNAEQRQETSVIGGQSPRNSISPDDDNIIEGVVAKFSEMKDGEMRECALGDGKVLVVKDKGQVHAVGSKCTHYGAPMAKGAYLDGRVRCPWHGACFSVKTGDIEDFPGMDSLPCFEARVQGDDIVVRADRDQIKSSARTRGMCHAAPGEDKRVFVIVGGGAAGAVCAQTLRELNFKGRVVVISKEEFLPYDRPKLSKAMNAQIDKILLRPREFYEKWNIEFLLKTEVTELDADAKTLKFANGNAMSFDACLVATGGAPRTLPVAGFKSSNVHVLRDIGEAHTILDATKGKHVLVVGSSFIGMETAASVVTNAASVTVIGMEKVAFERVLGTEVGSAIQKLHESKNIKFIMEAVVTEMKTADDKVTSVVVQIGGLAPGTEAKEFKELNCDVVVVGAGVVPATNFIKPGKSIKIDERERSIYTDNKMHAGNGIYAAGDIARYPLAFLDNELARIEHWGMAQYQGLVAAHNMVGKTKVADAVPFFWTAAYGKTVRYAGHALRYDEIIVDKEANGFNAETLKFAAYYCHKGKVLAVATLARDPLAAQCAELMQAGKMPTAADLQKAIAANGSTDALIQSRM